MLENEAVVNGVQPDELEIDKAVSALLEGALVAFPTETVYGLGADATNPQAVARIFAAKGRPRFNPLIVHVADREAAMALGHFNSAGLALARAFWPGPLTVVVKRRAPSPICDLVSAGLDTIAIRVPAGPVARALLTASRLPIAAPSANRSGHVSATTAAHVAQDLGTSLAMILDGGACAIGLESTIVDASGAKGAPLTILRQGAITQEAITAALGSGVEVELASPHPGASDNTGPPQSPQTTTPSTQSPPTPRSPGQLASHYAPNARLRLNAAHVEPDEALLAFGGDLPAHQGAMINLSARGDVVEAAAAFFEALRTLDALPVSKIAVMPIPEQGLGAAINDRLNRASAPRPAKE